MHIEKYVSNGQDHLRIVRTIRVKKPDGRKVNRKEIVKTFGLLSKYDDGKPDYMARLRQSFIDKNPLIPEMLPYVEEAPKKTVEVTFTEDSPYCNCDPKSFAPCILDPVFSGLGLDTLFASAKNASKITYDLQGIVRLLTYGRILDPASKCATMRQNNTYYAPLVRSGNDDNVYDALDVIYQYRKQITQRMNTCITRNIGRKADTIFYDVTNFFFETEEPDEDETDESGQVIQKGLRQDGVSKENRKQPIVQMGLFLDDNGIPISIEIFPGNTLDHLTLRSALRNTVDTLDLDRFVLVADRGMYSGTNMCHVISQGNGYIVSKSLKKSMKKERQWTLSQEGYTVVSTEFKYKSRIVERTVKDEDGTSKKIKEKVVVYWSKAFYERERYENKSFLEFIEKLKENPNGFRVTAAQSSSLKKFMKKDVLNKETGELLDGKKLLGMIDDEKLKEYNDLMGYYQIVSSELDMGDTEIIDRYHELTRIEDQFREMKSTLETRPIYVRTPEHIQAHLMICFIALTMLRVIQLKVRKSLPPVTDSRLNWTYGMSGSRVSYALKQLVLDQISGQYYRLGNLNSEDLRQLLTAMNVTVPGLPLTAGEIRSLKSSVKPF